LVGIISAAQLSAPPHLIATSSAIATSMRGLGGAIALAIYNVSGEGFITSSSTIASKQF
jgi:hypothetical protein